MEYGFLRAACISPKLEVANCSFNAGQIIECVRKAQEFKIQFLVFPELCITGYTCQDLFLQQTLQSSAEEALKKICRETKNSKILFAVGLPLAIKNEMYNCAAFCSKGKVVAIVPKSYIPNYSEFYEGRWFSPYTSKSVISVNLGSDSDFQEIPFGTNIIIQDTKNPAIRIACEICEDLWVSKSPSVGHANAGATVIANLSASNEVAGKAEYRRLLVSSVSAKLYCAYIYANASNDESTTDMIFSGHNLIALNGSIKAQSRLFEDCGNFTIADLDIQRLVQERVKCTSFVQCSKKDYDYDNLTFYKTVSVCLEENLFNQENSKNEKIIDGIELHPFVPEDTILRKERCLAVIEMQAEGLAKRLRHIHSQSAVIGLSGGLDSTLALLVTARAFDKCSISREKILCATMPAFGTTDRTYQNACSLAKEIGASLKEIDIKKSVLQHFDDIGHDTKTHDVTYENAQARTRTLVLMDLANQTNGIVIGTGDLSELALGWCTYNGDQMSNYGVNNSIPKTLVRSLVNFYAEGDDVSKELKDVLNDILATPVSPELLPPDKDGNIAQKTESTIGSYILHDFFLYNCIRNGFSPKKIYFLAKTAIKQNRLEDFSDSTIKNTLKTFYKRFFSQQFKRSCMPDGVKVGTVSLSPRGDWRMPSDALADLWLKQVEEL